MPENLFAHYHLPDGTVHLAPYLIEDREAMQRELTENEERNAELRAAKEWERIKPEIDYWLSFDDYGNRHDGSPEPLASLHLCEEGDDQ